MGFFSELKEDLSQAVNELMPVTDTPEEPAAETEQASMPADGETESVMVDNVSLEDMLKNIDEIQISQEAESEENGFFGMPEEAVGEEAPAAQSPEEPETPAVEETAETVLTEGEEPVFEMLQTEDAPAVSEETDLTAAMQDEPAEIAEETEEEAKEEVPVAWELRREIEQKKGESESKGAEKKMDSMAGRQASDETAIITSGMEINGDINSEGSIDLVGTVCGNIEILGKLNVTGHINGNSKAAEIYAEGAKINGEIISEGAVKIGASSVIIGNITATSAAIAGAVKGDIDVKGPVILDASAIVMGNIKSKSVQINNGAVIEGMCSQCYADVSPTSFFDEYKPDIKGGKKSK